MPASPRKTKTARGSRRTRAAEPASAVPSREARRAALLEAAYAVVADKGLEGLRTRDVAARAGVNIATLHYYFGTKEALVLALVERVRDLFTREDGPPGG